MNRRTILIVDDQEVNRAFLTQIIENEYSILTAENGSQALEILHNHYESIAAVFLDIIMPGIDGYQVLREMKADDTLSIIPVLVTSQLVEDQDEILALSLGAQDFISKPYKPDIIRQRLSNIIKLRENAYIINRIQKDHLTGLSNKEYFISRVEDILSNNQNKKYDIIYIGIEKFKLINDTYGMKKGNEVLVYLADIINDCCDDTSICSRFYADNFYIFCEHRTYTNDIFKPCIERIKMCPIDMRVKIHCGIFECNDSIEVEGQCARAKIAADMNRGKYDDYFTVYNDDIKDRMKEEQFILGSMTTALEENQFQVYYQPKYDLASENIIGAEALVRWIHPIKGLMPAGEFIPIFEKNGFITQLDIYVWECTCRNLRHLIDKGYPPISISVNMSRADIYNPNILDILLGLINKYDIPVRCLHLEITESAYTENPEQIVGYAIYSEGIYQGSRTWNYKLYYQPGKMDGSGGCCRRR